MEQVRGKKHSIIIVAEGVMSANELAKILRETADIDIRYSVLGHVQRGGSPSARDRVIASQFGSRAVEVLLEGHGGKAIGMQKNQVVDYNLEDVFNDNNETDMKMYKLSQELSI